MGMADIKIKIIDNYECTMDLSQWEMLTVSSADFAPRRSIYDITREFVRSIDPEITTIFTRNEFCAWSEEKVINVTFHSDNPFRYVYDAFIYKTFGVIIHPFLTGILHEIGHVMTFDEQLNRERSILYNLLDIDFDIERADDFATMYFNIPSEFEATKWGVEYYLSHKEHCDNFLKEIGYEAY